MMLSDVDISDFYCACGLYAVRRTTNKFTLHELLQLKGVPFTSIADLAVGDILVWDGDGSLASYPSKIKDNILLTVSVKLDRHFAVYEGNGIVSDLSFLSDIDRNQWPILRMRELDKLTSPDRVIR